MPGKYQGLPRTKARGTVNAPKKTPRDIASHPDRPVTRKGMGAKNQDLRFKA